MGATLSTIDAALKETWTSDRLVSQLYDENRTLDQIEKTRRYHVGQQAVSPIITNRNGGFTMAPAAGSSALNAAGNVGTAQAAWQYSHAYQQVQIESAAIDGTDGSELSVANIIDTEVEGALSEVRKQLTRQLFGDQTALIAQCTTTSGSATVNLLTTGYGPDALARGWLHPGQTVDIGTTASEGLRVADSVIASVSEANSTITVGSSITTASTDYVSIANARSGTTSYEMNGLRNIVSTTADLGGLSVASNPTWQAADVDATTTSLTLDVMYVENRKVKQKTGGSPDFVVTSLKQEENFYKLLQMQVRFQGDQGLGAGNVEGPKFAGMSLNADPDCPDRLTFFLSKRHLFVVQADKPAWQSKITGGKVLDWKQGTTAFVGALMYRLNVGTDRRDAHSALTTLTA